MGHTDPLENPPSSPRAWRWRCHKCGAHYRLGVTSRCLRCGHRMCSARGPSSPGKKKSRSCSSVFDFDGWSAWQEWKRDVAVEEVLGRVMKHDGLQSGLLRRLGGEKSVGYVKRWLRRKMETQRQDRLTSLAAECWKDCEFPSHCFQAKSDGK